MISTATEIWVVLLSLVLVALSASLIAIGWGIARKTMMEGFRMGRISQGQPDVLLAERTRKGPDTKLGDDYDPWNEAATGKQTGAVPTVEG